MKSMEQSNLQAKKMVVGMSKDKMIEKMRKINSSRNDNTDSRKNALKILMGGIPIGDKVFVIVPVEDLHIDKAYQRPVQSHVKTLAQEWDDMKCDPLKINYRIDGNLYVWDGQHRLVALKMMCIDYVLCVITVGLSQSDEAALFGCQGDSLKKPDPYDIFKAHVCAGEAIDTAIKDLCDKWGLIVNRNNKRAGNLSCLTLTREIFRRGHGEHLDWVLELLHEANWNEFTKAHCHRIINALYEIKKSDDDDNKFIQRKLITYLRKTNPDDLLVNATIQYPQFQDESKKIKLFLLDVVNRITSKNGIFENQDRFIA